MRLTISLALLCISFAVSSQERNSLLWEISGNGLEKPSYLYGTMHVSKKIAFRLDDVFFESLDKAEVVALESDPNTWLAKDTEMGTGSFGFSPKGFYTEAFRMDPPTLEDIGSHLSMQDRMLNNLLYRTNEYNADFEEDTYLDMFIYQCGRKFNKSVIALEDLEESTTLVGRANLNAMKQKPDEWLQKKMQGQDLMFLMQEAYRERNIDLLDSIDRAMYTPYYLNNMLYLRNINMAERLDSVIRGSSVFAGIGAAHLPGEKGVISLLREKGYSVNPLISEASPKGMALKEKLQQKIRKNTYTLQGPEDDFFTLKLSDKLYPVNDRGTTSYICPDLANGSYLLVNRIPTYNVLHPEARYSLQDLDRLLFENIPGKILSKKRITRSGYSGIDIMNRLKNGDHQRYQIYLTPLEVVIFKMGGENDYVVRHSDIVFNTLKFKPALGGKQIVHSGFGDFELEMPNLHRFTNKLRSGERKVEGYDPGSGSYYFLINATLNDLEFLEDDAFERHQIQKRFYQDLGLDPEYDHDDGQALISEAPMDSQGNKLFLKTLIRRGDYYLLGVLSKDRAEAKKYFDSFRLQPISYPEVSVQVRDTAMLFSTVSPVKPPKFVDNSAAYKTKHKTLKPYEPFTKKSVYRTRNNEKITVTLSKAHNLLSYPDIDSLWVSQERKYAGESFHVQHLTKAKDKDTYSLQLTLTDTASSRGILVKNVVKGGLLYELKALTDTLQEPSTFVKEFYDNFTPVDTLIGAPLVGDRTADFFRAIREEDSLADKGYQYLSFNEYHLDSLAHYIAYHDFKDDRRKIHNFLIEKLGELDSERSADFLERYYKKAYHNSHAQAKILQAFAQHQEEASVRRLLDLMATDLPLVSNDYMIREIFRPFREDLDLASKLYPELLEFASIAEYKAPIIDLLAEIKQAGLIKPKAYKKYRGDLLNDAKIYLKRHLGQQNTPTHQKRYFSSNRTRDRKLLQNYLTLLFPFAKEQKMMDFFYRLWMVQDPEIGTSFVSLLASHDVKVPQLMLENLARDINSRVLLYDKLSQVYLTQLIPEDYRNQLALAEALVYSGRKYAPQKDEIVFLKEQEISYKGNTYSGYFFKTKSSQNYLKNYKLHLLVFSSGSPYPLTETFYKNKAFIIEDTMTDREAMDQALEAFHLKEHPRAVVYGHGNGESFGPFGF